MCDMADQIFGSLSGPVIYYKRENLSHQMPV